MFKLHHILTPPFERYSTFIDSKPGGRSNDSSTVVPDGLSKWKGLVSPRVKALGGTSIHSQISIYLLPAFDFKATLDLRVHSWAPVLFDIELPMPAYIEESANKPTYLVRVNWGP